MILASLVFYAFWDLRFVPVLVGLTLVNWLVARAHAASPRGWWADAGILLNLGVLGWVKYANFVADNVAWILGGRHEQWNIILPLGVSFYVFQKVSYLVDLKRGQAKTYALSDFFLFVTFFPQLVAGPLVRHNEVIWQFALDPRRPEMAENLARGFVLFTIGLVKKVAIADTIAPVADAAFGARRRGRCSMLPTRWLGTLAYTLQIYFDFSGYSDMALGLALMFGLRPAGELRRALSRRVDPRVLAALAHDAVALPARLPLRAAGRQPGGRGAPGGQRDRSPCCWAGCGTAPPGPSSPGAGCTALALAVNAAWSAHRAAAALGASAGC